MYMYIMFLHVGAATQHVHLLYTIIRYIHTPIFAVLYPQRTMKQACRKTVVFPGFSLTLHTDAAAQPLSDDITSSSTLLRDVGLPDSWCALPTHLEVVQILDTTTLPLLWVSPLHCSLYPPQLLLP